MVQKAISGWRSELKYKYITLAGFRIRAILIRIRIRRSVPVSNGSGFGSVNNGYFFSKVFLLITDTF
jgi:hypothetical protein